jgi:hypothetical protein
LAIVNGASATLVARPLVVASSPIKAGATTQPIKTAIPSLFSFPTIALPTAVVVPKPPTVTTTTNGGLKTNIPAAVAASQPILGAPPAPVSTSFKATVATSAPVSTPGANPPSPPPPIVPGGFAAGLLGGPLVDIVNTTIQNAELVMQGKETTTQAGANTQAVLASQGPSAASGTAAAIASSPLTALAEENQVHAAQAAAQASANANDQPGSSAAVSTAPTATVTPFDPTVPLIVVGVIGAVALIAVLVSKHARRAAHAS